MNDILDIIEEERLAKRNIEKLAAEAYIVHRAVCY